MSTIEALKRIVKIYTVLLESFGNPSICARRKNTPSPLSSVVAPLRFCASTCTVRVVLVVRKDPHVIENITSKLKNVLKKRYPTLRSGASNCGATALLNVPIGVNYHPWTVVLPAM